jgi:3D (Asp-Asp-Asp) domain-containing protein
MKFKLKRKTKEQMKRVGLGGLVAVFGFLALYAPPASAETAFFDLIFKTPDLLKEMKVAAVETAEKEAIEIPMSPEAIKTMRVDASAYTSRPRETDGSPFITADGSVVRDGIIATNVLPFGTKVRIPSLYGDKIFEVHDRMNARYYYRVDVWMPDLQDARQFGVKRGIEIEIIEMGDGKKQWDQWKGRGADLYQIGKYGPADSPLPQPYIALASDR